MRIDEIIEMPVNPNSKSMANGNQLDPELEEIRKRKRQIEDGIDPDTAEIVQDFPI
jgi:hypothetical protein